MNDLTTIWVEKLDLWTFIYLGIFSWFKKIVVRYDENNVTKKGQICLKYAENCKSSLFIAANLSMGTTDSDGKALIYSKVNIMNECLKESVPDTFMENVDRNVKMLNNYISGRLDHKVSFFTMVIYNKDFNETKNNIIYLSQDPLNSILTDCQRKKGYVFKQPLFPIEILKQIILMLKHIADIVFTRRLPHKIKSNFNLKQTRPSIWIEHPPFGSPIKHDFFVPYLDPSFYDIIYYADRRDTPINKSTLAEFDSNNKKWIELYYKSLLKLSKIDLLKVIASVFKFAKSIFKNPLWLSIFKLECEFLYLIYHSVYKRFNVKVLYQHRETLWLQEIQAQALEAAGGIMLGVHWSAYVYLNPFNLTPQHVYFVWSSLLREYIKIKGNNCRSILPSGMWIDQGEEQKSHLRAEFNKNVDLVISVFDSHGGYKYIRTKKDLSIFYMLVLDALERAQNLGGIVKSKGLKLHTITNLPNGLEIKKRMELLINQNRLIFLPPSTSPAIAALNSDVSVCISVNSAGIIAGVLGKRTIQWDTSGILNHPIYKDPDQKILFHSYETFKDALIKVCEGDKSIGSFFSWKKKFSYFDDNEAGMRVGRFVQDYMCRVIERGDHLASLENSARQYLDSNNIKEDFFSDTGYWNIPAN